MPETEKKKPYVSLLYKAEAADGQQFLSGQLEMDIEHLGLEQMIAVMVNVVWGFADEMSRMSLPPLELLEATKTYADQPAETRAAAMRGLLCSTITHEIMAKVVQNLPNVVDGPEKAPTLLN